MAEHKYNTTDYRTPQEFREAVCIDAMRVYNSCCEEGCSSFTQLIR